MNSQISKVIVVCGALVVSARAFSDTIRVDPNAPTSGLGDLADWSNACHSLATAIGLANSGDEIWVADGVYKPTTGSNQIASFELKGGVAIYGGFSGPGDATLADRNPDPETNNCILSGDLLDNDIAANFTGHGDNSYHVVRADGELVDESAILDGFTIRGGAALGDPDDYDGAGIRIDNDASPRITRCRFMRCTAARGAGAAVLSGTAVFRDCRFIGNHVFELGGGAYVYGCKPTFVQCRFVDNHSEINGGGLQVYGGGSPRIFNTIFQDNSCDHVGGGLSMRENDTHLETLVVNCVFLRNSAEDTGGGARVGFESNCRFVQCTFVGNYCLETDDPHNGCGGGLSMGAAGEGAESPEVARLVVIDNCIFWHNQIRDSEAHGSQIALIGVYPGTATIEHCDIMDSDTSEPGVYVKSGWTAPTHTAWIDADPDFLIDPAPGTGGWGHSDDDYGDLRVNAGSPVISNGDCALVPNDLGDVDNSGTSGEVLPLDLRLEERRWSGVDMGAYERQTLCYANIAGGDSAVGVADLLAVISNWGPCAAFPASCPVDFTPLRCADHAVGVAELLAVINTWGECLGEPNTDAPTTVAECMTFCGNQFGFGTPEYQSCLEKCCSTLDE